MPRALWQSLGWAAVLLALAGAVLPLVPTTPLLLLAAAAFARSSPRLEAWLLTHPRFGPAIGDWRRERSIAPAAKLSALFAMVAVLSVSFLLGLPGWLLLVQAAVLGAVGIFIATRPRPARRSP